MNFKYPSRCRADSGLSPARNVRRPAHTNNAPFRADRRMNAAPALPGKGAFLIYNG